MSAPHDYCVAGSRNAATRSSSCCPPFSSGDTNYKLRAGGCTRSQNRRITHMCAGGSEVQSGVSTSSVPTPTLRLT